jgi:hypothetical protein
MRYLLNVLVALAARIDLYELARVLFKLAMSRVPGPVLLMIEMAVRAVDALDLPGEDKFYQVMVELRDPENPLRDQIRQIPVNLLLNAIQGTYELTVLPAKQAAEGKG